MKLAAMRSEVQECERRLQSLALAGFEGTGGADPVSDARARAGAERVRWQREREQQRRDQLLRDIACLAVLETS